jgi:hypothetical protein
MREKTRAAPSRSRKPGSHSPVTKSLLRTRKEIYERAVQEVGCPKRQEGPAFLVKSRAFLDER